MKKLLFVCLSLALILAGCNAPGENAREHHATPDDQAYYGEQVTRVKSRDQYHEYLDHGVEHNPDVRYELIVQDKNGNILFHDTDHRQYYISYLTDNIMEINKYSGTGITTNTFVRLSDGRVSVFDTPIFAADEAIGLIENRNPDAKGDGLYAIRLVKMFPEEGELETVDEAVVQAKRMPSAITVVGCTNYSREHGILTVAYFTPDDSIDTVKLYVNK